MERSRPLRFLEVPRSDYLLTGASIKTINDKEHKMMTKIKLSEQDIIDIQFTLRQVVENCKEVAPEFIAQTKKLLDRFEDAMEKIGFKDPKNHTF